MNFADAIAPFPISSICGYVEISTIDDGIFMNALYSNSSDLEDAVQYYSAKSMKNKICTIREFNAKSTIKEQIESL